MLGDAVFSGLLWVTFPREGAIDCVVHEAGDGLLVLLTVGKITTPVPIGPEDSAGLRSALDAIMPPVHPDLPGVAAQ